MTSWGKPRRANGEIVRYVVRLVMGEEEYGKRVRVEGDGEKNETGQGLDGFVFDNGTRLYYDVK